MENNLWVEWEIVQLIPEFKSENPRENEMNFMLDFFFLFLGDEFKIPLLESTSFQSICTMNILWLALLS